MLEFRTSPTWRIVYWVVTVLQAVVLSLAIATGNVGSSLIGMVFLAFFFILALQSRHPVHIGDKGIADERVLISRAWSWDDVESLTLRSASLLRPDVTITNKAGKVLPLNLRGLVARRDGEALEREEVLSSLRSLARRRGATVDDQR